jgi:hypothetical protein
MSATDDEIIRQRKAEIFQQIWQDPYLHAMISDGLISSLIIDKDTNDISEFPKDKQYFVICVTTIPVRPDISDHKKEMVLDEMTHITAKYFTVNDLPVADGDDMEVYWVSVPILY